MKRFIDYLRLFYPPTFRRLLKRIAQESYHAGWSNGFDRGHFKGFMACRARVAKNPSKYPYEKPTAFERTST